MTYGIHLMRYCADKVCHDGRRCRGHLVPRPIVERPPIPFEMPTIRPPTPPLTQPERLARYEAQNHRTGRKQLTAHQRRQIVRMQLRNRR